jgi:hypothetical protein
MKRPIALAALAFFLSGPPVFAADQSLLTAPSLVELDDAPTVTVDWNKGNTQAVTLHGNRTLVFVHGQKGGKYLLIIKQDGTGSRNVTWPSSVNWPGAYPPALTTTANKKDYINLFCYGAGYDLLGISQGF